MVGSKIYYGGIISLLSLLSIGLEACGLGLLAPRVTREDIIGVWVEERCATASTENSPCGYFEFFPDGRFVAYNIPTEGFLMESYGLSRATTSGSWELGDPPQDPFLFQPVHLQWDRYGTQDVYISGNNDELTIVGDMIDEWRGIFVKKR